MKTYRIFCWRVITESTSYAITARDLEEAEQIATSQFNNAPMSSLQLTCEDSDCGSQDDIEFDDYPNTADGPRPRRHD